MNKLKRQIKLYRKLIVAAAFILATTLPVLLWAGCRQPESSETQPSVGLTTISPTPGMTSTSKPTPTLRPTATVRPTPTVKPTATPAPTATPVPTPIPEPSTFMKAIDDNIPCYAWADQRAIVLQRLSFLDVVGYLAGPDKQGFTEILLEDGRVAYCLRSNLAWKSSRLFAQPLEGYFASVLPGQQDVLLKSRLVDVRQYAPDIQIDQLFATKRNFTGINLYGRSICMLQEDTLKKLIKAQEIFRKDGYCIKLFDAYRPYSVTQALSAYNSNPIYLADPATGSHHNRGVAVDITLVDLDGNELEMPSHIHTLNETSSRNNPDITEAARRNLDYMSAVMVSCGFRIFQHEWWHFTDTNRLNYPVMDFLMTDFQLVENTQKIKVTPPPLRNPDQTGFVAVSPTPTPSPTPEPSPLPTLCPTPEPSPLPTLGPTPELSPLPTPTEMPAEPSPSPTP